MKRFCYSAPARARQELAWKRMTERGCSLADANGEIGVLEPARAEAPLLLPCKEAEHRAGLRRR
jgi:hypothetical protein